MHSKKSHSAASCSRLPWGSIWDKTNQVTMLAVAGITYARFRYLLYYTSCFLHCSTLPWAFRHAQCRFLCSLLFATILISRVAGGTLRPLEGSTVLYCTHAQHKNNLRHIDEVNGSLLTCSLAYVDWMTSEYLNCLRDFWIFSIITFFVCLINFYFNLFKLFIHSLAFLWGTL